MGLHCCRLHTLHYNLPKGWDGGATAASTAELQETPLSAALRISCRCKAKSRCLAPLLPYACPPPWLMASLSLPFCLSFT